MWITKRVALFSAAVAVVGLVVTGCASGGSSEPIRIGVEGPLSGEQAPTGVGMLNGAQLAADDINASGGINGRVSVDFEDVLLDD